VDRVIATQNTSERCLPAGALAEAAAALWGEDQVDREPDLESALALAVRHAEQSGGGVVVTGSVVTVGEARAILREGE
jgi:dihydrofolate synthase/folylpolyglutamate synthase